ncbi:hypothetical protein AMS68_003534 [Peltaster fructicola]|uniref:HCNGP-like protein n=1 Tax=Peltaster fructicola TaxID=286661 RepID=A0A6H0XTC1_9PEZI|nr:hypothetical protein AMS68_003534 [Peltaster fructicola]
MSALVGYASSDEEDEVELKAVPEINGGASRIDATTAQPTRSTAPPDGPIAGPVRPEVPTEQETDEDTKVEPPLSPYSANRAQIQALTMPRFPNFDIPRSPSPPAVNSEEAAELTARTRKFERFLELKKQGVHFNDRLASSTALRNPELLQQLSGYAGISPEEQYENTLGDALAAPLRWPNGFLESLVASNQKKMKRDRESRTKLDFVPASVRTKRA